MSLKKMFLAVSLLAIVLTASVFAQSARTTRYWDSCKPSCAWTANSNPACVECNVSGGIESNKNARNACESGGTSYTCMYQAPWTGSDGIFYAFAASHTNATCGKCYELTFTSTGVSGKKMRIMISNIGGDVGGNQFDLMIPGGGVGIFNALSNQISQNGGPANPALGQQYGGFRATCGNNKDCIRNMCNAAFPGDKLKDMRAGCHWYVDDFDIADNPNANYTEISCPEALSSRFRGTNTTYGGGDGNTQPPTTYTITTSVSPNNGGSVTRNPNNTSYSSGTAVTLTATAANGYRFDSWTATSGSLPTFTSGNANTAEIRFNITSNVSIRANFVQEVQQYSVTVGRNPTAGGNVSVNNTNNPNGAVSYNSGTAMTITATPNANYKFVNWTPVTGSLPAGVTATNATITFTLTGTVNIRANFEQEVVQSTYSVQVSRNTLAGGNVTITPAGGNASQNPSGSITVNVGTNVTVAASTNSDYTFSGWTVTGGTSPSGVDLSSPSITFSLTANQSVNLRANWTVKSPGDTTRYVIHVSREPSAGGNFYIGSSAPNPGSVTRDSGTSVTITAQANNNYKFTEWSGSLPEGVTKTDASITFIIVADVNITANFERTGSSGDGVKDTIKVEAEDLTQTLPQCDGQNRMCVATANNITNIGYINENDVATYNVSVENTGSYTLVFRIASNYDHGDSRFDVLVNNSNVGTITGHTGDWDGYTFVELGSDVTLNAGNNTIRLNFLTAVNVDYFLIIGERSDVSVKPTPQRAARAATRMNVSLSSAPGGFFAGLPAGHKWTTFKLIDLQGREIQRGKIGPGVTDLRFTNLKSGVVFLKLEGPGIKPTTVRATTAR